jgi:hypothetical protein
MQQSWNKSVNDPATIYKVATYCQLSYNLEYIQVERQMTPDSHPVKRNSTFSISKLAVSRQTPPFYSQLGLKTKKWYPRQFAISPSARCETVIIGQPMQQEPPYQTTSSSKRVKLDTYYAVPYQPGV